MVTSDSSSNNDGIKTNFIELIDNEICTGLIDENLLEFFMSDVAHSMILKGTPGSGKTTLALQILDTLRQDQNVLYVTTRTPDKVLLKQFKWVEHIKLLGKKGRKSGTEVVDRTELRRLEGDISEPDEEDESDLIAFQLGYDLPEMEEVYNHITRSY